MLRVPEYGDTPTSRVAVRQLSVLKSDANVKTFSSSVNYLSNPFLTHQDTIITLYRVVSVREVDNSVYGVNKTIIETDPKVSHYVRCSIS